MPRQEESALEATTNTWAVAGILRPFVEKVVVSNPVKTRAIAEARIKTDKVDAQVLAQLLRCDYLPSVWIPEPEVQDLRQLTGRRAALIVDRAVVKNRVTSALAQKPLVSPVTDLFTRRGFEWLSGLSLDEQTRLLIDSYLRLLEGLTSQIERLDGVLFKRAFAEEKVKLLITLPGIDVAVAQSVLAAWGDMARFKDADHAASYHADEARTSAHERSGNQTANRGVAPGSKRPASYGSGMRTRTLAALPKIYQAEGLPKATPPDQLLGGETRVLEKIGMRRYVMKLQEPQVIVKREALRQPRPAR